MESKHVYKINTNDNLQKASLLKNKDFFFVAFQFRMASHIFHWRVVTCDSYILKFNLFILVKTLYKVGIVGAP